MVSKHLNTKLLKIFEKHIPNIKISEEQMVMLYTKLFVDKQYTAIFDYLETSQNSKGFEIVKEISKEVELTFGLSQQTNHIKIYNADELIKMDLPPLKYQIPNLILDKGLTLFAGQAESAKSLCALDAGLSIATGKPFLNTIPTLKGKVLYLDEENGLRRLKSRVNYLVKGPNSRFKGESLKDLLFISYSSLKIDNDIGQEILKQIVEEFQPTLIILDSLVRMIDGQENEAGDAKQVFQTLKEIYKDRDVAFLLLHHASKGGTGMNAVRGSSDFINGVDIGLLFKTNDQENKIKETFLIKNRDIDRDTYTDFNVHIINEDIAEGSYACLDYEPEKCLTLQWVNKDDDNEEDDKVEQCKSLIKQFAERHDYKDLEFGIDSDLYKHLKDRGLKDIKNTLSEARNQLIDERYLTKIQKGLYKINNMFDIKSVED